MMFIIFTVIGIKKHLILSRNSVLNGLCLIQDKQTKFEEFSKNYKSFGSCVLF